MEGQIPFEQHGSQRIHLHFREWFDTWETHTRILTRAVRRGKSTYRVIQPGVQVGNIPDLR
jgi:hypothetical protein